MTDKKLHGEYTKDKPKTSFTFLLWDENRERLDIIGSSTGLKKAHILNLIIKRWWDKDRNIELDLRQEE